MGGKSSTTTQSVQIPPEVLARYNAVNARAEQAAQQPFQQYGGQFVAGLTPTQQAGVAATSEAAGLAQPYYQAATQMALSGTQDVGPLNYNQIGYYMNPFTEAVAAPTYQALRQQQGQELSQQQAQAIKSGAAFGDRSALERANMMRQQALGTAQAMAPIYSQGYQQAVQTAAGQQGVIAQDLARRMQGAQQIAGLGTGAQAAALQGAQAQLAAGTAEQQTQQADLSARYQQFLQERGYPFQVAQFLANIAMGTGALSGSTTTTTSPAGFFSDERLKEDAVRIGETDEGLPIYSYRYKGQNGPKQIGLMAQDVEKVHPEAVGLAAAADGRYYKTVDYEKATERPRKEYGGGLDLAGADENWMGGAVQPESRGLAFARGGYAPGGVVDPNDIQALLAAQRQSFGPFGDIGLYGGKGAGAGAPGGGGIVPDAKLPVPRLMVASGVPSQPRSGFQEAAQTGKNISELYSMGKTGLLGSGPTRENPKGTAGLLGAAGKLSSEDNAFLRLGELFSGKAYGGPVGYAEGGEIDPYDISEDPLGDVVKAGKAEIRELPKPGQPPSAPKSGLGELADFAKGAASLYSLGSTVAPAAASGLSSLIALLPFSDERMKKDVEPVGETYDGQTVYRYNLGDGITQIGLMAQESRKDAVHKDGLGLLHLDYKKATDNAVPFAYGGLVPRQGYQVGGEIEDYSPEADLPAIGAQEVAAEDDVARIANAIRRIESSNRYNALGPVSPKSGDRAYGAYQVMGANIPSWSKEAIGREITPQEFLESQELQDQIAKHRMGKYLDQYGDPTEVASMWFSGRPTSRSMSLSDFTGTSVPKYLQRFRNAYEGDLPAAGAQEAQAQSRAPLGEAAARKASEYAGVEAREAGVGDLAREYLPSGFPTSEKFWIPALGFVGSMLASKSPTLGQAIGEGLVGGVSSYQSMVKQQADMAKTVIDIVKDRFIVRTDPDTGQTIYMNKMTGRPMSPLEFQDAVSRVARGLGVSPAVLGLDVNRAMGAPEAPRAPTAPGTTPAAPRAAPATQEGQPSATQAPSPAAPAEGEPKPPVNKFNMSLNELKDYAEKNPREFGLVGERDPAKLRRDIAKYEAALKQAEISGNESEAARFFALAKQSRDILNQNISDAVDFQYKNNLEIQKASTQRAEDYRKDVIQRADLYSSSRSSLTRLADIYSRYEPGRPAAIKAELQQWFAAVGIPLPESFNAGRYDEALKIALTQAFKTVEDNNLSRAPKAALTEAIQTTPAPQLSAGAVYSLIGKTIGEMDYYHNRDRDYLRQGRGMAPEEFLIDYSKNTGNTPNKFIRQAFAEIPRAKGVGDNDIEILKQTYGDFTPKIAPPLRPAGGQRQEQQPAASQSAPQIPPPDKREPGKIYQTPQGPMRWTGKTDKPWEEVLR